MIVEELASLILQARCIAVRFQPQQLYALHKDDLNRLLELAKKKAEFIEKNSNYHAVDFSAHKNNERLLKTILDNK